MGKCGGKNGSVIEKGAPMHEICTEAWNLTRENGKNGNKTGGLHELPSPEYSDNRKAAVGAYSPLT